MKGDELVCCREEVNRENRLAIRLLAIAGLPLSVANMIVQMALSTETDLVPFFLRTSWVFIYFIFLLALERWIVPKGYTHATLLLYLVEAPIMICSILLGSIWDPTHLAFTFFIFLMAMPVFVLDRPIRVTLVTAAWTVLFVVACYLWKPADIFERDFLHAFEFFLATMAVANVVLSIRMVSLDRLLQTQHRLEHDELTDARNRKSLENHADEYLGKPLMVVAADFDQLSMYNDYYGHDIGNQALIRFIGVLSDAFGSERTYRYGGNEAICVSEDLSEQECLGLVEACRERLRESALDDCKVSLSCAIGYVAGLPDTSETFRNMVQLAQIYAHKASSIGKNQTVGGMFDEETFTAAKIESSIETHVRAYETNQLTGLPSMSVFVSRADEALANAVDQSRDPVIGYFNLACINSYNSEFGYAQGDELICYTAKLLREAFPYRLLCSITGSKFGIMCYREEIEPAVEAIKAGLQGFCGSFPVVFRIGFAMRAEGNNSISVLDKAQVAERSIRHQDDVLFRFYDEQLDEDIKFREYIVAHLDEAIEQSHLEVYYQPIMRSSTRKVCNEEALSRWNDPVRGLLAPYKFIPPLEESRLVYKLSLHVVRQVLADFKCKQELGMPLVPVSVNLSRHDFEQCDMVQAISELVDASGFSRDMIRIEITESAFVKNQGFLIKEVARFRENGFEVWMDDFGSEYSTLNLLQDLDVDLIKIDMQFMRNSSDSGKNLIIVSNIINMARQMGIATLVEGVETEEHLGVLRAMGCDKMQGFLFSKPLPLDTIIDDMRNGTALPFEDQEAGESWL